MDNNHKLLDGCKPVNIVQASIIYFNIRGFMTHCDVKCDTIGSFGKKNVNEEYNDIDIAVQYPWGLHEHMIRNLERTFGQMKVGNINHNLHVVNFKFEYEEDKFAQVDLMFVDNLKYARFAYHSPDFKKKESEFKGMYASILLQSAVRNIPVEREHFEDGSLKEWKYYKLSQQKGLLLKHKTFIGLRGKPVKTAREISETFVTDDVTQIMETVFKDKYAENHVYTFEKLLDYITSPDFKGVSKEFHKEYIKRVKDDFLSDWQFEMKTPDDMKRTFEILFNLKLTAL